MWGSFVRDLYGRYGIPGIHCIAGILRTGKMSVYYADGEFDSSPRESYAPDAFSAPDGFRLSASDSERCRI